MKFKKNKENTKSIYIYVLVGLVLYVSSYGTKVKEGTIIEGENLPLPPTAPKNTSILNMSKSKNAV